MTEFLKDAQKNKENLRTYFETSQDVQIQLIDLANERDRVKILLIYCEGLCDLHRFEETVLPQLRQTLLDNHTGAINKTVLTDLNLLSSRSIVSYSELADAVFEGKLIINWFDSACAVDVSKKPNRTPEDSNFEISLFGARDGFIEDLTTNVALIRKRLNTPSLCVEKYHMGQLNHVAVSLVYLKEKVNSQAVEEFRRQLRSIEVDLVQSNVELIEMLSTTKYAFMPKYRISGRPDFVVESLRQSKFAVFVDGTPSALVAPINLAFLLTGADDPYVSFPFVIVERILRYTAFMIALLGPGFYVGVTSLHPDQVPLSLLATLVNSRMGLPLPTPLEAFLMLLLFEIFKESGTHLPQPAGSTLSTVGGLIIGDAAIRAGMASPALVVVVSASAVSLYAVTNHALASIISILRVGILILSAVFGLFGFILSCIFIVTYFSSVRSFGVPFLEPMSPFKWKLFRQAFISPWTRRQRKRI